MKKIYNILASAVAVVCMSSCNDIMDVNSTTQLSDLSIWNSEEAAEGYIIASYQCFTDHANVFAVDGNLFYDAYSDLIKSTSYDQYGHLYNKTWLEPNRFGKNNGGVFGNWGGTYGRIKRANLLLNDLDRYGVPRYGEEWAKVRRAEIRFCRAVNYWFLARVYGGVVIRTDKSGKSGYTDDGAYPEDCNRARVSEKETYDFIINEMQEAIADLPVTWKTDKDGDRWNGRATKGMVYGFLSRIALYAHEWAIAADAAEQCKTLGGYELVSNYANLFNCAFEANNRKEIIYGIYGLKEYKTHQYELRMRPIGDAGVYKCDLETRFVPTAELADLYEFKDGTEFDWSTWNKGTNKHADPFTDREPRFHATILYNDAPWEGRKIGTYVGQNEADESKRGADYFIAYENAASTKGHTCTGYYLKKFIIEGNKDFTTEGCWNTDIILRYAEVLLNKAEAYAELGEYGKAMDAINEVRARVSLPKKTAGDYDSVMEILRKERCCELAGEGHRFWDLWRWRLCGEVINGQKVHGVKVVLRNNGAYRYDRVEADVDERIFQDRYYYLSLPADELTNNNLCVDNPNW